MQGLTVREWSREAKPAVLLRTVQSASELRCPARITPAFGRLASFYHLVSLRWDGYPSPSTPKNIDLHHSTPGLFFVNFTGCFPRPNHKIYYLVNPTYTS